MTKTKQQKITDGTYTAHRDEKEPVIAELLYAVPKPMMNLKSVDSKRFFKYVCEILISR
jgi:hypothetical protein